jgi:hypothetical protein
VSVDNGARACKQSGDEDGAAVRRSPLISILSNEFNRLEFLLRYCIHSVFLK